MGVRLRADERGQMMLLAAVVLILAFLAMASMVSRVAQLASSTTQEQDRPILLEVTRVSAAVDGLITDLRAATPDLNATSSPTFDQALEAGMRHLAVLEASQGLSLDFGYDPSEAADAALGYNGDIECDDGVVWIRLTDGEVQVELPSTVTFSTATCS